MPGDDCQTEFARCPRCRPCRRDVEADWDHNLGYGRLGSAAFKTGNRRIAEPFLLKVREGLEYLVVGTAAGAEGVVVVTVEDGPLDLQYGAEKIGKGRQLLVDSDDFPAMAASGLHSPAELDRTTAITGKPVAEITRVGRPGMASGIGFLAGDEDILSVLRGDNELVGRLGLKPLTEIEKAVSGELDRALATHFTARP